MTERDMAKRQDMHPRVDEATRTIGRILTPAVDIFETEDQLTLVADMPGVDRDGLEIDLDKNVLTINGTMAQEEHGQSILREFSSANYYRQFRLSERIAGDKSEAHLDNGVLTLVIPKTEAAKPKKITIKH